MSFVQEDQRLLVLKTAPDLGFGGLTEHVALVEGFEEELFEVEGRLMPCRQIDDAVDKRCGPRMMGQVAKDCRLPYPGLAAHLDGKARVECRERLGEIHLAIDKAPNQSRAEENRRGAGTKVRRFGAQGLTNHGAARVADLQEVTPYRYFSDDPPDMEAVAWSG